MCKYLLMCPCSCGCCNILGVVTVVVFLLLHSFAVHEWCVFVDALTMIYYVFIKNLFSFLLYLPNKPSVK